MLVGNAFFVATWELPASNPTGRRPRDSNYIPHMDAMDRVIASLSPDDTAAALGLLKLLEECGQMKPAEAEEWRRRITGWARFNAVGAEVMPNAGCSP